ncbi:MAG: hypothetical protein Q7S09_03555 [bacterium]|nr:hypothetical protein [bacterium]
MEFYTDIEKSRPLIEESIGRFGYAPEHNTDHYIYSGADYKETILVRFEDGSALLTHRDPKTWDVFSEPVASPERRAAILIEFLQYVLGDASQKKVELHAQSHGAEPRTVPPGAGLVRRVNLELHERTRRELLGALPKNLRARSINYTLLWPVFDLTKFDTFLAGGRYKDLRNAKVKFYREHRVEVRDAREVSKEALRAIPKVWKSMRRASDRVYTAMYDAYIENDFRGTTYARAFIVDGHVAGINAGWAIPNSTTYYAAIGLHDYSSKDLGDALNLEDLAFLKAAGFTHADFAGGEKALTTYKLKFGEARIYKSFIFSVARRQ